jgi:hypothetical protein
MLNNLPPWTPVGDGVSIRSVPGSVIGYDRKPLPAPPPPLAPAGT